MAAYKLTSFYTGIDPSPPPSSKKKGRKRAASNSGANGSSSKRQRISEPSTSKAGAKHKEKRSSKRVSNAKEVKPKVKNDTPTPVRSSTRNNGTAAGGSRKRRASTSPPPVYDTDDELATANGADDSGLELKDLPAGTWDEIVECVYAMQAQTPGTSYLVVFREEMAITPRWCPHSLVRAKMPHRVRVFPFASASSLLTRQQLIDFYERHLHFVTPSSE